MNILAAATLGAGQNLNKRIITKSSDWLMLPIVASQIGALFELPDIVADSVLNGIVSSFFCICYGLISLCVIYYCKKGEMEMELIQSFSVDHTRIVPGIFTSRIDTMGEYSVTTYDVRLKRPNREPVIDVAAMHSLEHIIATYLRNDPEWKDEIVYWGPMGCLTGFYLIVKGNRAPQELYPLLLAAFKAVDEAQEVPGAAPVNCGHYLMHNLGMAKWYAKEFADYLEANADRNEIFEYPKTERLVTDEGQHFYDS